MNPWTILNDRAVINRLKDEAFHAAAVAEINSGNRRLGLWAKAIAESGGDEFKAKTGYLALLVVALRDEDYMARRAAEEAQNAADALGRAQKLQERQAKECEIKQRAERGSVQAATREKVRRQTELKRAHEEWAVRAQERGRRTTLFSRVLSLSVGIVFVGVMIGFVTRNVSTSDSIGDLRARAVNGNAKAQVELANKLEAGDSVAKDETQAAVWYTRAAQQGERDAQFSLARIYHFGYGVVKDDVASFKWARLAAEQGDIVSEAALGRAYHEGLGVSKNMDEAAKWNARAASHGNATAQWYLSDQYENGNGVTQDLSEAYAWMYLAQKNGAKDADAELSRIAKKMTASQLAEAHRRISAMVAAQGDVSKP